LRSNLLAAIIPERRDEVGRRLNKARNFFKHGSEPSAVLEDFSDEQNMIGIAMASDGLARLLGVELIEARIFMAWLSVAEPGLMLAPPPTDFLTAYHLDDFCNQPRVAQKELGRDILRLVTGPGVGWEGSKISGL
jgi:hypothetical protein